MSEDVLATVLVLGDRSIRGKQVCDASQDSADTAPEHADAGADQHPRPHLVVLEAEQHIANAVPKLVAGVLLREDADAEKEQRGKDKEHPEQLELGDARRLGRFRRVMRSGARGIRVGCCGWCGVHLLRRHGYAGVDDTCLHAGCRRRVPRRGTRKRRDRRAGQYFSKFELHLVKH